jgi:hypothetical protein
MVVILPQRSNAWMAMNGGLGSTWPSVLRASAALSVGLDSDHVRCTQDEFVES